MGNYNRDTSWRSMQQPPLQPPPFHTMRSSHAGPLPVHTAAPMNSNTSAYYTPPPSMYNNNNNSNNTNNNPPLYYTSTNEPLTLGKRPRLSSTTSSSGGSSAYDRSSPVVTPLGRIATNDMQFLRPLESLATSNLYGAYSPSTATTTTTTTPALYEREHNPLPDFNSDWFLTSRMSPIMGSLAVHNNNTNNSNTAQQQLSSNSSGNTNNLSIDANSTGSQAATRGGDYSNNSTDAGLHLAASPRGATSPMLCSELLPDYDASFYSIWNGPIDQQQPPLQQTQAGGRSMILNNTTSGGHQQYGPRDAYAPLNELHQGDFQYFYEPLAPGASSSSSNSNNQLLPPTPTATDFVIKPDVSALPDVRIERLPLPPPPPPPVAVNVAANNTRKRKTSSSRASVGTLNKPTARATLAANPSALGGTATAAPQRTSMPADRSGFRNLARNAPIETTRRPLAKQQPQQQPISNDVAAASLFQPPPTIVRSSPASNAAAIAPPRAQSTPPSLPLDACAFDDAALASTGEWNDDGIDADAFGSSDGIVLAGVRAGKKPRSRQCDYPGCGNRARSHQKCKKHGGAHQCVYDGCTKNSQSRGLCIAHGGGSRCKVENCVRAAQSKGLCKSHGGGEFCAVDGCRKKAHLKHLCRNHGGGVRCKSGKCIKWAQRKGWCMAHAKEVLDS